MSRIKLKLRRAKTRFLTWHLGYDQGIAEIMNRVDNPTKEEVEKYGMQNILRARRQLGEKFGAKMREIGADV